MITTVIRMSTMERNGKAVNDTARATEAYDVYLDDLKPPEFTPSVIPRTTKAGFPQPKRKAQASWYRLVDNIDKISTEYEYSSLAEGEFRLLYLHPGDKHSRIRCTVLRRPMDSDSVRGNYAALSYTWGKNDPNPVENEILLRNEEERPRPVKKREKVKLRAVVESLNSTNHPAAKLDPDIDWDVWKWKCIRENLFEAIVALRHATRPSLIWICLPNQLRILIELTFSERGCVMY